jgi:hypothetical protein
MQKNTKINYVIFTINSLCSAIFFFVCVTVFIPMFFEIFFKTGNSFEFIVSGFFFLSILIFFVFPIIVFISEWKGTIQEKYKYLFFLGVLFIILGCLVLVGTITNVLRNGITQEGMLFAGIMSVYFIITGIYRFKMYNREEYPIQL